MWLEVLWRLQVANILVMGPAITVMLQLRKFERIGYSVFVFTSLSLIAWRLRQLQRQDMHAMHAADTCVGFAGGPATGGDHQRGMRRHASH